MDDVAEMAERAGEKFALALVKLLKVLERYPDLLAEIKSA